MVQFLAKHASDKLYVIKSNWHQISEKAISNIFH